MDIGILGGGIAGLSLALALRKQGYHPRVYERQAGPATLGAGVTLWPNATFVLEELGLLHDIQAIAGRPTTVRRQDAAGQPLGGLDIDLLNRAMGYPTYTVLRSELQAVLLAHAARAGIDVAFGRRALAIELDATGRAVAQFDQGARIRPDLLIGADGRMASVARTFVAGDNTPVYQGFVNWVGVAQAPQPLVDDTVIQDVWGMGERFGCVPIRPERVYWAAAQARPLQDTTPAAGARETLETLFASWPEPVLHLIRATPESAIRLIAVHDLEPLASWSRANVLLVGDAAHAPLPTSGQGACQALEDAWHLARCLAHGNGDLETVFQTFAHIRAPKTRRLAEQGRRFAQGLFATDPEVCRRRNEQAKGSDPVGDVQALAAGWGQGLPILGGIDDGPGQGSSVGSLYRLGE